MTQREQVAVTSRVCCLVAVFGLSFFLHREHTLQAVLAVAAIGAMSAYVSYVTARTNLVILTGETLLVGLVMGLTYPSSVVLMPYLVVLPLLAGIFRGLVGVGVIIVAEAVAMVLLPLLAPGLSEVPQRAAELAPWLLTNAGGGLLGVWARSLGHVPQERDPRHPLRVCAAAADPAADGPPDGSRPGWTPTVWRPSS